MTRFDQLKNKYPDDVKKAYREYILSKTIYRVFYCHDDAPQEVKDAMSMQKAINNYCEEVIQGRNTNLINVLGLTTDSVINLIQEKSEVFDFLEMDQNSQINHLSGFFATKLKDVVSKITWKDLEGVIKEENNNEATLSDSAATEQIKNIANQYGISSIAYGKVRTTQESIQKLENSLSQLKEVVDCSATQVGLNKFNIFLDASEFIYAGSASYCLDETQIKLYLNERLSHDAFAHEWLHGMDMLMNDVNKTNSYMYSVANKGAVKKLLKSLDVQHIEDIKQIKATILEDTVTYTEKIVDRFVLLGSVNEPEGLKFFLKEQIQDIKSRKFNSKNFLEKLNKYMKDTNGCPSYLLTELSMLNKFLGGEDKEFKGSYFLEYAKEMQKSLEKTGLMTEEYSTLKEERFARAFESFVHMKLKEKGLKNDIAQANISAWTPKEIETRRNKDVWEEVMMEIRDTMNKIKPNKEYADIEKHNLIKKISDIRKKFISAVGDSSLKIK